ncbi:MAG: hypothetical protein AAFO77_04460 [Pseudomonadota bacterium]
MIALVLFAPLLWALAFNRNAQSVSPRDAFLTNKGANGFRATLAGAIAGNVGIGSFLALFLFANEAPILAFSIVGAYTLGLLLCAAFAATIRERAGLLGAVGLIDLIAKAHAMKHLTPIWIAVAFVFVLRSAVQLGALGFLAAAVFGGDAALTIIACAALIALYLLVGGYRAAVQSDALQAAVIVAGGVICAFGLPNLTGTPAPFFSFGEYRPAILVGIWLFIPWSAVLAVDNWQRVTLARSTQVARSAYVCAAAVCGCLFLLMAFAGLWAAQSADLYATFAILSGPNFTWVATAMFIACIMSSIDTFIMPLVSVAAQDRPMMWTRLMICALVGLTAMTAILFSDTLDNIIAAFNSLGVFLPAAFGALYLKRTSALAAVISMYAGLFSALGIGLVDQNVASVAGFVVAAMTYALVHIRTVRA